MKLYYGLGDGFRGNKIYPHGLLREGRPAADGSEAPCSLLSCGLELGNVAFSPGETQDDLAAHLRFCTSKRYVSKVNQR